MNVIPAEATVVTDEKIAEPVVDAVMTAVTPAVETVPESANEIIPVVEGEIMETAASESVVSEIPAAVTQALPVSETPVVSVTTPTKATSGEEEGLIEGIVNLLDDDADGKLNTVEKLLQQLIFLMFR